MLSNETYLITGTSRGLGFEMAKYVLTNSSSRVVGLSRGAPPPELLSNESYLHLQLDLSDKAELHHLFGHLKDKGLTPSKLVLNAALQQDKDWEKVFYVNCIAPLYLIKASVKEEKPCEILVVNSIFAWFADSKHFAYAASKRALAQSVQALRAQSDFRNVNIVQVFLGPLANEREKSSIIFSDKADVAKRLLERSLFAKIFPFLSIKDWALHVFFRLSSAHFANQMVNQFRR